MFTLFTLPDDTGGVWFRYEVDPEVIVPEAVTFVVVSEFDA
jgi:hypothetical protein